MTSEIDSTSSSKFLWAGRVTSAIPVIALLASGLMKISNAAQVVEGFATFGYHRSCCCQSGSLRSCVRFCI